MAIPAFPELMRQILQIADDGMDHRTADAMESVAPRTWCPEDPTERQGFQRGVVRILAGIPIGESGDEMRA